MAKILCVVDRSSANLPPSKDVLVEFAYDLAIARFKLKHNTYDGIVIDDSVAGHQGLDAVEWIRNIVGVQTPIARLFHTPLTSEDFRSNCTKPDPIYIAQVPIPSADWEALLATLAKPASSELPKGMPLSLKKAYDSSIVEKLTRLEALVRKLCATHTVEALVSLRDEVHRIAGGAATYGYPKATEACLALQNLLRHQLFDPNDAEHAAHLQSAVDTFIPRLIHYFQFHYSSLEAPQAAASNPSNSTRPSIFLVTADKTLVNLFADAERTEGFHLETERDHSKALHRLAATDFHPLLIVIDKSLLGTALQEHAWVDVVNGLRNKAVPPLISLVIDKNEAELHVKTAGFAADSFLKRPLSADDIQELVKSMHIIWDTKGYRVLVVDDSKDDCAFISHCFKELGIEVFTLQATQNIIEDLEKCRPHLLLLDINMPDHTGWDLLQQIRGDSSQKALPVVMITTVEDSHTIAKAYANQANDILSKPLERATLQVKIRDLVRRFPKGAERQDSQALHK